jgi:hypothetical protein|tara:strand:- start:1435 stop:1644 length:210 start_codon:yes stop_codon:yes gene_type:complete
MLYKIRSWLGNEIHFKLSDWEVSKEISTLIVTMMVSFASSFFVDKTAVVILTMTTYIGLRYLQRGAHHA